jgi:hypothetical protein
VYISGNILRYQSMWHSVSFRKSIRIADRRGLPLAGAHIRLYWGSIGDSNDLELVRIFLLP